MKLFSIIIYCVCIFVYGSNASKFFPNDDGVRGLRFLKEEHQEIQQQSLATRLDRLESHLQARLLLAEEEISNLKAENGKLQVTLKSLSTEVDALKSKSAVSSGNTAILREKLAVSMPTSCSELSSIGHTLSGFYSVKNGYNIDTVFCDFAPDGPGFETRIGTVDVKSSPVRFYVQRASSFSTENTIIPFEVERLNVGDAMNLTSGVFTAPRSGVYFFSMSGIKDGSPSSALVISMHLNGVIAASSFAANTDFSATYSMQSTFRLKTGDQVTLRKTGGTLSDSSSYHYTHFTGWLLDEDLFQ